MKIGHIYALIDPRDNTPRYVGQTTNLLHRRLAEHIKYATNRRTRAWVSELQANGLLPEIRSLEEVDSSLLNERECHWVDTYRAAGIDLMNVAPLDPVKPRRIGVDTQKKQISLGLPTELLLKIEQIAKYERRTTPRQIEHFLTQAIDEYERQLR